MADTTSSVKKHYDYAQQQIDEQAILDKFNAATAAQYNAQREQNRQAENQFYNQMYNTQQTAMDTIRKSNAAAVSSGASRGVQAANELSAILGLEQESVASATELANANRQTAQEETAAVLENVLNAYQQAVQERQQLVQQGIEAESVDVQQEANTTNKQTADASLITSAAENGTNTYLTALTQSGIDYSDGVLTPDSQTSFQVAVSNIGKTKDGAPIQFVADDWAWSNTGAGKANEIANTINAICDTYGLDKNAYADKLANLKIIASNPNVSWAHIGGGDKVANAMDSFKLGEYTAAEPFALKQAYAADVQRAYQSILDQLQNDYISGANRIQK